MAIDSTLLIRVDQKLDGFITETRAYNLASDDKFHDHEARLRLLEKIDAKIDNVLLAVQDHETRLRDNEAFKQQITGALKMMNILLGILGTLTCGTLGTLILHLFGVLK